MFTRDQIDGYMALKWDEVYAVRAHAAPGRVPDVLFLLSAARADPAFELSLRRGVRNGASPSRSGPCVSARKASRGRRPRCFPARCGGSIRTGRPIPRSPSHEPLRRHPRPRRLDSVERMQRDGELPAWRSGPRRRHGRAAARRRPRRHGDQRRDGAGQARGSKAARHRGRRLAELARPATTASTGPRWQGRAF